MYDRRNCRDIDNDVFYPEGNRQDKDRAIALAKSVCEDCVIKQECLMSAVINKEEFGIWGGEDFEDPSVRKQLKADYAAIRSIN